ncbi:uncharacterized protein LOC112090607 [Morus notabilis]|uniref:uncharacterized protein LOC112090607 n=1 Tax=Morus notabilis TaxID=981085 RepID=UPI000CED650C|nr:uncharacterized protein LOC112090607 [Morus notabilis]
MEHFGHRHIWNFPEEDVNEVTIVQDTESRNVLELVVDLPELDNLTFDRPDIEANTVTSDVDAYLRDKSPTKDEDDFIDDGDDETVFDYIEDELVDFEDDDDIESADDVEDIRSDDE